MSINVTVTGNPLKIQKGKMVTASPNTSQKDFERRRLIRLSQVREQSKNIAEDVRNRVRRQKLKQVEIIEKNGQIKLKQWQARKLLELQNQYHEALRDIGTGHKEACSLEGEEITAQEKLENYNKIAKQRASTASRKLQEEKEKINQSLSIPVEKKKLVKKMEDKRAHMIRELKKSSENLKKKKDEQLCFDSDVSGIVTDSDSEYDNIEEIQNSKTTNFEINLHESTESIPKSTISDIPSKVIENISQRNTMNNLGENNTADLGTPEQDIELLKQLRDQKETRISDRIKRRNLKGLEHLHCCNTCDSAYPHHGKEVNYNDGNASGSRLKISPARSRIHNTLPNVQQNIYTCSCNSTPHVVPVSSPCFCSHPSPQKQKPNISDINQLRCRDFNDEVDIGEWQNCVQNVNSQSSIKPVPRASPERPRRQEEIPTRPKVTLKSFRSPCKNLNMQKGVQSKSRNSKFPKSHVEKIEEHNLITSPVALTQMDFFEKMKQRDKEAFLRGQKALEREKLQREYNNLMTKLPILQRLERLYEINQDKPEYHMTEDRLQEQERKKQAILDTMYEKLFPDTSTKITIPVKRTTDYDTKDKEKTPQPDDFATLNLGVWESEKKSRKLYTEEEVQAILREGKVTSDSKFRTDQLKSVLEKLRKQKDELLKEIQNISEESAKLSTISFYSPESRRNINRRVDTFSESSEESKKQDRTKMESTNLHTSKIDKKLVSVKFGTKPLQNSSSYETIDEPSKKQIKICKPVKSKGVQVTKNLRKSKTVVKNRSVGAVSSKLSSPQKLVKKRRPEKEIFTSSEQSSSDQRNSKNTLKESSRPSSSKKQKQVEIPNTNLRATPELPKNSSISVNEDIAASKKKVSKLVKPLVSCECNKDYLPQIAEELCEIIIKIKEGKSSQVLVTENTEKFKNSRNSTTDKLNTTKKNKKEGTMPSQILHDLSRAMIDDCCQRKDNIKPLSWHDKLSKNNSQVSNSSTSYISPPHLSNKPTTQSKPLNICPSIRKKQQPNFNEIKSPPSKLQGENSNTLDEVKRLLTMSRLSIDDLGVSSVSTVTTPSQSIIDLDSNKGNIIMGGTNSTIYSSMNERNSQQVSDERSQNNLPNFSYMSISTEGRTVIASEVDNTSEQYPDILTKYAKIADKCSQRISNLSAMIDKVREEKNKMLQTSSIITTNDSSTKYMDLPSPRKSVNENDSTEKHKSSSSSGSGEGSNLLEINMSLAEKLKGLSPEEIEKYGDIFDFVSENFNDSRTDDLAKRLRALRQPVQMSNGSQTQIPMQSEKGDSVDFVPLLLDIPKMPLLTADSSNSKHKRPPPSKSFLAARRLTDYLAPHELSTIPEQDSQTRLESTIKDISPRMLGQDTQHFTQETIPSPKKITQLEGRKIITQEKIENVKENNKNSAYELNGSTRIVGQSKLTTNKKKRNSKVNEVFNISDNSLCSSNTSGDEKLEMFRIEAMLRSIGMDWAISTLRKTQEALALTSSSSSLDLKSPATIKELSEADIKEFFTKQLFQKISSSTLRSDASTGSLDESHDMSEIKNGDFSKKQTSTPVNRSRELLKMDEKTSDVPSAIESEKESREFFSFAEHSP